MFRIWLLVFVVASVARTEHRAPQQGGRPQVSACSDPMLPAIQNILKKYETNKHLEFFEAIAVEAWLKRSRVPQSKRSQPVGGNQRTVLLVGETERESPLYASIQRAQDQFSKRGWNVKTASADGVLRHLNDTLASAKRGDQVFIQLLTHANLDPLGPVIAEAAKRNIHIAVGDYSCHSEAAQSLSKQGACLVTVAPKDSPGVMCTDTQDLLNFTNQFFELPDSQTSLTLEDQFLKARKGDTKTPNLAQISSLPMPGVQTWNDFLRHADPESVDVLANIGADFKSMPLVGQRFPTCTLEEVSATLRLHFKALEAVVGAAAQARLQPLLDELETHMNNYSKIKKEMDSTASKLNGTFAKKMTRNLPKPLRRYEPNAGDISAALELLNSKIPLDEIKWINEDTRTYYERFRPYKGALDSLLAKAREDSKNSWDSLKALEQELSEEADALMIAERRVYDEYQELFRKTTPNPCNTFYL